MLLSVMALVPLTVEEYNLPQEELQKVLNRVQPHLDSLVDEMEGVEVTGAMIEPLFERVERILKGSYPDREVTVDKLLLLNLETPRSALSIAVEFIVPVQAIYGRFSVQ